MRIELILCARRCSLYALKSWNLKLISIVYECKYSVYFESLSLHVILNVFGENGKIINGSLYIYGKWCLMMMIPLTRDVWETLACGRQSLWCYRVISLTQILICCIWNKNVLYPDVFCSLWWVLILLRVCKQIYESH